jgi:hypothetical protein
MKQKFISEKKSSKKGIDFDPFFCLYEKRIVAGDSNFELFALNFDI